MAKTCSLLALEPGILQQLSTDESEGLAIIDRQKIIKTTKTQIVRAVISPFTLSYILCQGRKGKLIGRDRK